jgi:hypothetical protein
VVQAKLTANATRALLARFSSADKIVDPFAITVVFFDQLFCVISIKTKRFHKMVNGIGLSSLSRGAVLPTRSLFIVGHYFSSAHPGAQIIGRSPRPECKRRYTLEGHDIEEFIGVSAAMGQMAHMSVHS